MNKSIAFSTEKIDIINNFFINNIDKNFCFSLPYNPKIFDDSDLWQKKVFYAILNITGLFKDSAPWLGQKDPRYKDAIQNLVYWHLIEPGDANNLRKTLEIIVFLRTLICHDVELNNLTYENSYELVKLELKIQPENFFNLSDNDYNQIYNNLILPMDSFFDKVINSISHIDKEQIKNQQTLLDCWKEYIFDAINNQSFESHYFNKTFHEFFQLEISSKGQSFKDFKKYYKRTIEKDFSNYIYQQKQLGDYNPMRIYINAIREAYKKCIE